LSAWKDAGATQADFWRLLASATPWEEPPNEGPSPSAEAPLQLAEAGGVYTVESPTHGVRVLFDRVSEWRGGVKAEVTVLRDGQELLPVADLNLKIPKAQQSLAVELQEACADIPWRALLREACALVLRRYRQGEPLVILDKHRPTVPLTYTVNPLVFAKKISVLFATGGMGKSTFALFLALCISTGAAIAGLRTLRGKVLYLDYEDDESVHTRRLQAIQAGHPELRDAQVAYQRCVEPLARLTPIILRHVLDQQITFVVVDSLLAATGGDSTSEATTKLFIALRTLNVSCLIIGHTPKNLADGQEATIYGSVFNSNFSRSVWEVQKEQDVGEDGMLLALIHRKANLSRYHPPLGLKMTQNEDGSVIRFEPFDLAKAAALEQALPNASRIRNFLERDGGVYSAQEVSEGTGIKLSVTKFTLSKHKGEKWAMVGANKDAKWTALTAQ
jgi:hypothetical protein